MLVYYLLFYTCIYHKNTNKFCLKIHFFITNLGAGATLPPPPPHTHTFSLST